MINHSRETVDLMEGMHEEYREAEAGWEQQIQDLVVEGEEVIEERSFDDWKRGQRREFIKRWESQIDGVAKEVRGEGGLDNGEDLDCGDIKKDGSGNLEDKKAKGEHCSQDQGKDGEGKNLKIISEVKSGDFNQEKEDLIDEQKQVEEEIKILNVENEDIHFKDKKSQKFYFEQIYPLIIKNNIEGEKSGIEIHSDDNEESKNLQNQIEKTLELKKLYLKILSNSRKIQIFEIKNNQGSNPHNSHNRSHTMYRNNSRSRLNNTFGYKPIIKKQSNSKKLTSLSSDIPFSPYVGRGANLLVSSVFQLPQIGIKSLRKVTSFEKKFEIREKGQYSSNNRGNTLRALNKSVHRLPTKIKKINRGHPSKIVHLGFFDQISRNQMNTAPFQSKKKISRNIQVTGSSEGTRKKIKHSTYLKGVDDSAKRIYKNRKKTKLKPIKNPYKK